MLTPAGLPEYISALENLAMSHFRHVVSDEHYPLLAAHHSEQGRRAMAAAVELQRLHLLCLEVAWDSSHE